MLNLFYARHTLVWGLLLLLAAISWGVSSYSGEILGLEAQTASILLAFAKIRLVLWSFMEVRTSPRPLRALCDGWIVASCAGFLVLGS
ncbi:MAG: cytochrome C oxidase subunit IV family protein [Deltaproteobacteria bacterium]|nr:cytochrome C oxidase subunit IV family protein [Deltaproteobacteria bacterium]